MEAIARRCNVPAERGRTMAEFTTIGVGGPVDVVLRPESVEALAAVLRALHEAGRRPRLMGGGANVIAGPGPFTDPVVLTRGIRHGPHFEGHSARAGCGVTVKRLVRLCVERGLAGLEFAEGIPGTVGGTVSMNAGSFGGQMADVVREVSLVDVKGNVTRRALRPEDFSYRTSPFTGGEVIVEAVFDLRPEDPQAIAARLKEYAQKRLASQPWGEKSAGCIFRNPPGESAGRLIDRLGLKGLAVGGASVSTVHGNFIVNRGDATPDDVLTLIALVKSKVRDGAGVSLQEEVIVWRDGAAKGSEDRG